MVVRVRETFLGEAIEERLCIHLKKFPRVFISAQPGPYDWSKGECIKEELFGIISKAYMKITICFTVMDQVYL